MNKETIINILIALSVLLAAVLVIWFIIGDSPTAEQVLLIFVLPLYVFVFAIYESMNLKVITVHQQLGDIKQTLGRIEGKSGGK